MVNVAAYVALQKELLQLEREEERKESIASGDGDKLSFLESNGVALCRLSLDSVSTDVGGRQVVRLVTRGGRQLAPARISTGDLVAIREQKGRESVTSESQTSSTIEGVLTALDEKHVDISCDEPLGGDFDSGSLFAVTKITSDVTHKRYTNSLDALERAAEDTSHAAYSIVQALMGEATPRFNENLQLDAKQEKYLAPLNEKQREAVENALKAKDLAVIHGPPGTGKTHTLIAYILLEIQRGSRVLVVAPSNVAVDNIAERLAAVSPAPQFVRVGHTARMMPAVIHHSLEYQVARTDEASLAEGIRKELNDLETTARKTRQKFARRSIRIEQRELRKELRKREKSAVKRLLSRKDAVLSTISGAGAKLMDIAESNSPFDVVVVDEAAQALEAACWVSLLRARKAIFAGDPHQLGGTVKSGRAESRGLKRSILDRVFATERLLPTISMLVVQYRMNQIISTWSSQEFYEGRLEPAESVACRRVIDMESCKKNVDEENLEFPFILIDTAGGDCEEATPSAEGHEDASRGRGQIQDAHASRSNEGEAQILEQVVGRFIECGISTQDLAVISPYSGQVQLLRRLLWPKYGRSLEVATIDSFQGREKEIVCMSLVRSNEGAEVGFLSDVRRMNVAVTRAKRCVVVVCDTETISSHPFLARMVEYVEEKGHYRSGVTDFPEIVGTFSQSRRPKEAIEADEKAAVSKKSLGKSRERNRRKNWSETKPKRPVYRTDSGPGFDILQESAHDDMREGLEKEIIEFLRSDETQEKLYPAQLSAAERRMIHELAEEHSLGHLSFGTGTGRRIRLWKPARTAVRQNRAVVQPPTEVLAKSTSSEDSDKIADQTSANSELASMNSGKAVEFTLPRESEYEDINALLRDASLSREKRTGEVPRQENNKAGISSAASKKSKNQRRKGKKRNKSDEDFEAILAEYGSKQSGEASSRFKGPVAEIVNGKLTSSVAPKKTHTLAKKKLADKLAKEAEKRKRKQKD